MKYPENSFKTGLRFFRDGGVLRTSEALKKGLPARTLYTMRDTGVIEPVGRGLYKLAKAKPLSDPDLVTIAKRAPQGVLCLISALAFHRLTTQIPHEIHVALRSDRKAPRIAHPPVRFYWFSGAAYSEGIEEHTIDGVPLRVYGPEKTVADCFKFRNRVGLDVAIEALKRARERKRAKVGDLMAYARICRVEHIMKPYLEALL